MYLRRWPSVGSCSVTIPRDAYSSQNFRYLETRCHSPPTSRSKRLRWCPLVPESDLRYHDQQIILHHMCITSIQAAYQRRIIFRPYCWKKTMSSAQSLINSHGLGLPVRISLSYSSTMSCCKFGRYINICLYYLFNVPVGIWTWTDNILRVASCPFSQFGQRVKPAGERLTGWLGSHIPPFLNDTRHPWLVTRHSHQVRDMPTSRLFVNYHCAGPAGIRTWADSTLRFTSQRSSQFVKRVRPVSGRLAGWLGSHAIILAH